MSFPLPAGLKVVGRYVVRHELRRDAGSGAFVALDPLIDREVVLKVVGLGGSDPGSEERQAVEPLFLRQVRAAGKLRHPNILATLDAGLNRELAYLVLDRVHGQPMHQLLARGLRPSFAQSASIIARVADALDHAHRHGLVHGRLAPQHVLLQPDGEPTVEGFGGWIDSGASGLSALMRTDERLPKTNPPGGPGPAASEPSAEACEADRFAAVALLHMLLTGRAPRSPAPGQAAAASGFAPLRASRPDAPPALARIVDEGLNKSPVASVPSVASLRDMLTAYLWRSQSAEVTPRPLGEPPDAQRTALSLTFGPPPVTIPPDPAPTPRMAAAGELPVAPDPRTVQEPAELRDHLPFYETDTTARTMAAALDTLAIRGRAGLFRFRWLLGAVALATAALVCLGMLLGVPHVRPAAPEPAAVADPLNAGSGTATVVTQTGQLKFDIQPWGEILIDGRPTGVTPPMMQAVLPAGRHMIEIRHGDLPAWRGPVNIDPGQPMVVRFQFPPASEAPIDSPR